MLVHTIDFGIILASTLTNLGKQGLFRSLFIVKGALLLLKSLFVYFFRRFYRSPVFICPASRTCSPLVIVSVNICPFYLLILASNKDRCRYSKMNIISPTWTKLQLENSSLLYLILSPLSMALSQFRTLMLYNLIHNYLTICKEA